MTCKYSHMEIGKTYTMNIDAKCAECGTRMHLVTTMVYQGHGTITPFEGHAYYGDWWKEVPPVTCPNCKGSTGYFGVPCLDGLAEELFEAVFVPVEAISK